MYVNVNQKCESLGKWGLHALISLSKTLKE